MQARCAVVMAVVGSPDAADPHLQVPKSGAGGAAAAGVRTAGCAASLGSVPGLAVKSTTWHVACFEVLGSVEHPLSIYVYSTAILPAH